MRLALIALCSAVLLSSCDSGPAPAPIVVYAVGDNEEGLTAKLAEFTDDTRIGVTLVFSKSSKNVDLVINNSGSPTADVLMTNNVADIWRAGDEGALRPIRSAAFDAGDSLLNDQEGLWAAIDVRFHAIAMRSEPIRPLVESYDQLASPELHGRICLSSSKLHVNRSLLAMLIGDRGLKETERLVRGWMRNLAASPFPSEAELLDAIRDGTCDYGIASWFPDAGGITSFLAEERYFDIDGIGVARHAHQPDSAQRLVDWMLNRRVRLQGDFKKHQSIGNAGWRDEDARLLAERAGYR